MASTVLTEFSLTPIISERVTNLNVQHADLVHCPVCNHILWKPVTCTSCENSFCCQCIEMWLFEQQEQIIEYLYDDNGNDYLSKSFALTRCPFNCSPYVQRKCPPLLTTILSKLTIECRNKLYGCQEILFYEQLEKHEGELCPYKIIRCPGCQQDMFKAMFDTNEHLSTCLYVELECTKCQSTFKRKDKHDEFDCLERQIWLLRQNMTKFEQKSYEIFDMHRKRIDIINEKITIIEEIWETDNDTDDNHAYGDPQLDQKRTFILNPIQLFRFQLMEKWQNMAGIIGLIILFIFVLLIYIPILFC